MKNISEKHIDTQIFFNDITKFGQEDKAMEALYNADKMSADLTT